MPNNHDTSIVTSSNNVVLNQENHFKKINKNVLLDLTPKPSNTIKSIDVKEWDNLVKETQTSH